jgi:hypothetical protein
MSEEPVVYARVQPIHPRIGTIDDVEKRLAIPSEFTVPWFKQIGHSEAVYCIPLLWRRHLPIAPGHELEAWYVWARADPTRSWVTDPLVVLESSGDTGNEFYLKGLMYPAILATSNRKCRLSCADLFDYLIKRTGSKFWLVQEPNSLSILSDYAFQTGCGRLAL